MNTPSAPEFVRLPDGASTANVGWAVFSLTKTGPYGEAAGIFPTLWLRGLSNGIDSSLTVKGSKLRSDTPKIPIPVPPGYVVEEGDPLGSIVLLELPAGTYEFYRYSAYANPGAGLRFSVSYMLNSAPSFRYRFKVLPGVVNYLGDVNFAFTNSGPFRGGVRFRVSDERERDLKLFRAQLPDYARKSISIPAPFGAGS